MPKSSVPFSCVPCPSQCCLSQFSHQIFHTSVEREGRGRSVPTIMSETVGIHAPCLLHGCSSARQSSKKKSRVLKAPLVIAAATAGNLSFGVDSPDVILRTKSARVKAKMVSLPVLSLTRYTFQNSRSFFFFFCLLRKPFPRLHITTALLNYQKLA